GTGDPRDGRDSSTWRSGAPRPRRRRPRPAASAIAGVGGRALGSRAPSVEQDRAGEASPQASRTTVGPSITSRVRAGWTGRGSSGNREAVTFRVGFDVGGTFTDFALQADDGRLLTGKRLTTPDDPARACVEGLRELITRAGLGWADLVQAAHGTTL